MERENGLHLRSSYGVASASLAIRRDARRPVGGIPLRGMPAPEPGVGNLSEAGAGAFSRVAWTYASATRPKSSSTGIDLRPTFTRGFHAPAREPLPVHLGI